LEGSGNSGLTILSGNADVGNIAFGDDGANDRGLIQYNHSTDTLLFTTASDVNGRLTLGAGASIFNEGGADTDLRAEGSSNTHKLFLDAGNNILQTRPGTASSGFANIGGALASDTTTVGTDADTNEKTLQSYTIPANALSQDGQAIRITFAGITSANTNTKQLKIKLGSTTLYDGTAYTPTTAYFINFDFIIVRTGSSAQRYYTPNISWNNENIVITQGTSAEDMTSALVLAVTGQNGTALANEIQIYNFLVEYIG
jgi:hypothetical protein